MAQESEEPTVEATKPKSERMTTPEEIQTRRVRELGEVASSIFRGRQSADKGPDDLTAKAIRGAEQFKELKKEHFEHGPLIFPTTEGTEKGNPLSLDHEGNETYLEEITGIDDDGNYTCRIIDKNEVGNEDATRHTVTITPRELFDMNLTAERANIEEGLEGNELKVAQTYLDTIDPNAETPEITDETAKRMETVAREQGMLTASDLSQIVDRAIPADDPDREKAQKLLDSLNDKTVVDREDFHEALSIMGIDRNTIHSRADIIRADIIKQKNILKDLPNDEMATRTLKELEAEFTMINNLDTLWTESEKQGKTPFDTFFEKAQDGELRSGEIAGLLSDFTKGEYDSLVEKLPDLMGKTEEEKKAIKEKLKKGGINTLLALIYMLAAAGILTAGIVAEAAQDRSK